MTTKEIKEYLKQRLAMAVQNRKGAKNSSETLWYDAQIAELKSLIESIR